MQDFTRDKLSDSTRIEHIFSDGLLGRINANGDYVISDNIIKEIIDAKKYFTKRLGNRLYMYSDIMSLDRSLILLMQYQLNPAKDKVFFTYSVIEEEYMADGLTINSILTEIAHSIYDYSSDVILRAFRDFHVFISGEGEEERKRKEWKTMPLLDTIVRYNEAIEKLSADKFEMYYKECFDTLYDTLSSGDKAIYEQILSEYNAGIALHGEFFKDELVDGQARYKARVEILNNAIEKVSMSDEVEQSDLAALNYIRTDVMEEFRDKVKEQEVESSEKLLSDVPLSDKIQYTNIIHMNKVTESMSPSSIALETITTEVKLEDIVDGGAVSEEEVEQVLAVSKQDEPDILLDDVYQKKVITSAEELAPKQETKPDAQKDAPKDEVKQEEEEKVEKPKQEEETHDESDSENTADDYEDKSNSEELAQKVLKEYTQRKEDKQNNNDKKSTDSVTQDYTSENVDYSKIQKQAEEDQKQETQKIEAAEKQKEIFKLIDDGKVTEKDGQEIGIKVEKVDLKEVNNNKEVVQRNEQQPKEEETVVTQETKDNIKNNLGTGSLIKERLGGYNGKASGGLNNSIEEER